MDSFGHQHRYVRQLGDGWQLVETGGRIEAPELRKPCRRLATSTGRPVLAAQVFDSDWALLCAAVGDRAGRVTRLHDVEEGCCDEHGPKGLPGPSGRAVEDVVGELLEWSATAGLRADPAAVHAAVTGDQLADDTVFAVVRALGLTTIGRTSPRAFPVEGWPFSPISTLAYFARMRAAAQEMDDEAEPAAPWEVAAIALDAELWAAAYRPPVDVASLALRAVDVMAARRLARGEIDERQDDLDLVDTLLAEGRLNPEPEIADDHDRQWADLRAAR
ncbi:hypothetical protein DMB66_02290 [Actinoplanes sp. ATCC 53533]|nr:hypothetical protein DMB66_02290 [Actinoplanes sp. ATCC 53533]